MIQNYLMFLATTLIDCDFVLDWILRCRELHTFGIVGGFITLISLFAVIPNSRQNVTLIKKKICAGCNIATGLFDIICQLTMHFELLLTYYTSDDY